MSLLHSLSMVASKLGLIRIATVEDPAKPHKITTRPVALRDLATELRAAEVRALAQAPAEMSVGFEQLFAAADIKTPDHGWSVEKIQQFMAAEPYKSMPRAQAQGALLGTLASHKVAVEDLVKDAMARDKAIDAYAALIFQKRQTRRQAQLHQKTELQNQIFALKEQVERLEQESGLDDQRWHDWWQRKMDYEKQMAAAVSYLLKEPVVTIDAQLPADHNCD